MRHPIEYKNRQQPKATDVWWLIAVELTLINSLQLSVLSRKLYRRGFQSATAFCYTLDKDFYMPDDMCYTIKKNPRAAFATIERKSIEIRTEENLVNIDAEFISDQ